MLKARAAVRDCGKAVKINPDSPQPCHCSGKAFQFPCHWHKADKDFELACQLGYNEDTNSILTEVQRRVQKKKQRKDDIVDVSERMKKEPKEAELRTNKVPKDMEIIKKAALEEQDRSQEKDKMGRPWRKNRDESSRIAERVNTTQEVIEQQESLEQKALQEAVWYLEIEQQLIALQMELLRVVYNSTDGA